MEARSNFRLIMEYRGIPSIIALKVRPSCAKSSRTRAIEESESRTQHIFGQINPPLPSPPPIPPQLLMPATTFASPTDVRITRDGGNLAARSSIIRDVERFVASSPCPCLCKSRMTPRTSVYSSPINFPCSSTSASRSASGSCAHPIATELAARTASDNWPRFASIGSGV